METPGGEEEEDGPRGSRLSAFRPTWVPQAGCPLPFSGLLPRACAAILSVPGPALLRRWFLSLNAILKCGSSCFIWPCGYSLPL